MLYILWAKVREWVTGWPPVLTDITWPRLPPSLQDWDPFGSFQERLPLALFLMAFQMLYFPINRSGAEGIRLDLGVIDGVMPLTGVFAVPYVAGIWVIGGMSLIAAWTLPRNLYQQFTISFFVIMAVGFSLWLAIPAYIAKTPFVPDGIFEQMVYELHIGDDNYGNYNSFPSSHVYYITLLLYFLARHWRRWWFGWTTLAVINAWSTLLTHQHYFADVLAGLLLTWGTLWLTRRVLWPYLRAWEAAQVAT